MNDSSTLGRGRLVPRLATALVAAAVAVTPAACVLLAVPGRVRIPAPVGAAAWRADARHLPDPVSADPRAIRDFLTAAGPAERRALAAEYPGVVGALDGAPVALRYAADRQAMRAAGPPYEGRDGRFLLFDPRGDGRVAQVFGDLEKADRIAVLVPGAGNRGDNFWRGVGGKGFRSPAVQAADLYRAAGDDRLAVIAWLGYDTPQGVDAAEAREDLARAGAAALNRLVAGLVAVRPKATIALLGHSYGSAVIGLAAPRLPRQVTDLAVFGSPGMGVDDVTRLRTTARVWAGESARDWIRWVPGVRLFGLGHGTRPTAPGFGARVFPTADVADHDHYLAPGTDSLTALAGIAATGTDRGVRS
jgi:hypothetical protein